MEIRLSRRRIVIVGFGYRGRQWLTAIRRNRTFAVAGVVDPAEAARGDAQQLGLRTWSSVEQALDSDRPDAAVVASPDEHHPVQARQLLDAGLVTLIEKPVALSLSEARETANAAHHASVPALVGQSFRFRTRERIIGAVVRSGRLGALRDAVIASVRPLRDPPAGREPMSWMLWDYAIHHLDALCYRFGGPPAVVRAELRSRDRGGRWLLGDLHWDGPARDVVYRLVDGPDYWYHREWLEAERGGLAVDDDRVVVVSPEHRPRRRLTLPGPTPEQVLLRGLDHAVRGRAPRRMTIDDNLATIATLEAVEQAARSGTEVAVVPPAVP